MKSEIVQQFLFKNIAEINTIDINDDAGFDVFLAMLETVVTHTKIIDYEAGQAVRDIIDSNWDEYDKTLEEITGPEYGENVMKASRERQQQYSECRRQFADKVMSEITDELAKRCVIL